MLIFARELQRRAVLQGWPFLSIAAHPGWSATRIVLNGMGQGPRERFIQAGSTSSPNPRPTAPARSCSRPWTRRRNPAATTGRPGSARSRGPPGPSKVMPQAQDQATAERLWSLSEQLTGVHYG